MAVSLYSQLLTAAPFPAWACFVKRIALQWMLFALVGSGAARGNRRFKRLHGMPLIKTRLPTTNGN
jgi:hypothetical protein